MGDIAGRKKEDLEVTEVLSTAKEETLGGLEEDCLQAGFSVEIVCGDVS